MSRQGSFHVAIGFGLDKDFLVLTENSLSRQDLALMREFSCRDREFYLTIRLDKTNSFYIAIVWQCVARDREGQACTTRLGARDKHDWASTIEAFYRDRLLTMVKLKGTPQDWGVIAWYQSLGL